MGLKTIDERLKSAFPDAEITLRDLTGTEDHVEAHITSSAFIGVSPVERHRMVYRALGELMEGPIHALALHTHTPETTKENSS